MTFAWQTPAYWQRRERRDKQRAAAYVVREAKRKGELVPGTCAHADDECKGCIEAHHEDYDKPLEIEWLCGRHHRRLHTDLRRVNANAEPDASLAKATPGSDNEGA